MFKHILLAATACLAFTAPGHSEQIPVSFQADNRIKRFSYEEHNVYALSLNLKSVTTIQLEEGETVDSIVIGDSESWEVVRLKSGNVVSVKPIYDGALTNMTLYTDQRVYSFELIATGELTPGNTPGSKMAYRIMFDYPGSSRSRQARQAGLRYGTDDRDDERRKPPVRPLSYNYGVSGDAGFRPLHVGDDTFRTYFDLPAGAPRPAIYKIGRNGREQLVNSRTDGERIIVDGTNSHWVMRIGDEYVCVANAQGRQMASAAPRLSRAVVRDNAGNDVYVPQQQTSKRPVGFFSSLFGAKSPSGTGFTHGPSNPGNNHTDS